MMLLRRITKHVNEQNWLGAQVAWEQGILDAAAGALDQTLLMIELLETTD